MYLHVTVGAVAVLRVQVVLGSSRLDCAHVVGDAVASQAKLRHSAGCQQTRIRRTVRRMTGATSFRLHRSMLESKWTLLVRVTLHTSRVGSSGQSRLFEFKTAMRIVAITALHGAFENLVVEREIELVLNLGMAAQTKLGLALFQELKHREARLLRVCFCNKNVRTGQIPPGFRRMGRVAIGTTDVVAPVLSTPEVVVLFSSRMAGKTSLRYFFG